MGKTTITITEDLRDELSKRGNVDDSYEDVLWELLEEAEQMETGV